MSLCAKMGVLGTSSLRLRVEAVLMSPLPRDSGGGDFHSRYSFLIVCRILLLTGNGLIGRVQ
jgi:hypothetical protein